MRDTMQNMELFRSLFRLYINSYLYLVYVSHYHVLLHRNIIRIYIDSYVTIASINPNLLDEHILFALAFN